MAGYKRVNFYELCRLCASNQQKEKTHIFEEEGRKIQLQSKIQSCLSLKVCENDFLPKVVCSQCLRTLEECYTFRSECVNSESMLSSYFNNFRYTEDFKKSGKVYIKDTTTAKPSQQQHQLQQALEPLATIEQNPQQQINNVTNQQKDQLYYTVQIPEKSTVKQEINQTQTKIIQSTALHLAQNYNVNVNQITCPTVKTITSTKPDSINAINNITVNANGEIINLGSITDIEALIAQNMVQKLKQVSNKQQILQQPQKRKSDVLLDNSVIHIDLTGADVNNFDSTTNNIKFEKLPHIKATADNSKFMYTIKIEDAKQNYNQGIVLNQNQPNFNVSAFPVVSNATAQNVNIITPSLNSNGQKVKITSNIKLENQNQTPVNVVTNQINSVANQVNNLTNQINSVNNTFHLQDIKLQDIKPNLMLLNQQIRAASSISPNINVITTSSSLNNAINSNSINSSNSVNSNSLNGSSINSNSINGNSITSSSINGNSITGSSINGISINSNSINGNSINGNSINGNSINATSINANSMNGSSISNNSINSNSINASHSISASNSRNAGNSINASNNVVNASIPTAQNFIMGGYSSNSTGGNNNVNVNVNVSSTSILTTAALSGDNQGIITSSSGQSNGVVNSSSNVITSSNNGISSNGGNINASSGSNVNVSTGNVSTSNGNVSVNVNVNGGASSQGQGSQGIRVHVCDICQKVFKRREHLNQHLKLHTGYRPFVCESCNKSFMRKEHLLRHMTSHSGQKNFTCNICEKSFSRNDNLLKHKKTHDKQGKYTCEYCQKTFVMKHYYLAHKMTHEPEQKCVWNVLKV